MTLQWRGRWHHTWHHSWHHFEFSVLHSLRNIMTSAGDENRSWNGSSKSLGALRIRKLLPLSEGRSMILEVPEIWMGMVLSHLDLWAIGDPIVFPRGRSVHNGSEVLYGSAPEKLYQSTIAEPSSSEKTGGLPAAFCSIGISASISIQLVFTDIRMRR